MSKANTSNRELYLRLLGYVRPYWKMFALEVLIQGHTALVIAHRLTTIERADRILLLNKDASWKTAPMPNY